jgi:hypothetical protein
LDRGVLKKIDAAIKNAKVSIRHLGHWRKARCLGPPSNHQDSAFLQADGRRVTVADYFAAMCRDQAKGSKYRSALGSTGALKYPFLPCINIGSTTKPCWVPAELVVIPGGQSRSNECTGDMTADMIKYGICICFGIKYWYLLVTLSRVWLQIFRCPSTSPHGIFDER